jgi:hypothetical protein
LASGAFNIMASGLTNPRQVFVEAGGGTALAAVDNAIMRIDLTTKTATPVVSSLNIQRFVVEAGGATAIVAGIGTGLYASLYRVNLTTGALQVLSAGLFDNAHTLVLEGTGATALITESRQGTGALFRFTVPAP